MKKIIFLIIGIISLLVLNACGGGGSSSSSGSTSTQKDLSNVTSNTIYIFEKDKNNTMFIEKNNENDIIATTVENAKYQSSKILLFGDTKVFDIKYQTNSVLLNYANEIDTIYKDNYEVNNTQQNIPNQYIGIWHEDDAGDIAIAYIYSDKVVIFNANTSTLVCNYAYEWTPAQFVSALQNSIDASLYTNEPSLNSQIQNSCGSYASHQASLFKSIQRTDEFESKIDKVVSSSITGAFSNLFGSTFVGIALKKVYDWGAEKVNNFKRVRENIIDTTKKLKNYVSVEPTNLNNATSYENVATKVENNRLSDIRDDINNFEDNSDIQNDNVFKNTTFTYAQENDKKEIQTTKVISYTTDSKKEEKIPNRDENGTIVSVTKKTNFDSAGNFEEQTILLDQNDTNTSQGEENSSKSINYNTYEGIDGNSTLGNYTRVTKMSTYYKLYVHNVADVFLDGDKDILNSLNEIDFTVDGNIENSDGTWNLVDKVHVKEIWPKFWANWGTADDAYSTCYTISADSFLISFKEGDTNEYNQKNHIFIADYILRATPVESDFCKTKILKSFSQTGHIELDVGTYWPN